MAQDQADGSTEALPSYPTATTPAPGQRPFYGPGRAMTGSVPMTGSTPMTGSAHTGSVPSGSAGYPQTGYPHTGSMPSQYAPAPARTSYFRGGRGLVLLLCAVIGSGLGLGAAQITSGDRQGKATTATAKPTPVAVTIQGVTSFDPKPDGSGFAQKNGQWKAQNYNNDQFGGLKPGIGLVLDLGSAKALATVTFDAQISPLTVELHAGDTTPTSANLLTKVGNAVTANGKTTLTATGGGSHRYWMIYVTKLAPIEGGKYSAAIGQNSITATATP